MPSNGVNKVFLIGALAEEPRLKTTGEGRSRLLLRVHTVESYEDKTGLERERQSWHDVVVWGKRGEGLARFLRRGRRVVVEGRLHGYKTDGDPPRWRTEIVARDVVVLDYDGRAEASRDAA